MLPPLVPIIAGAVLLLDARQRGLAAHHPQRPAPSSRTWRWRPRSPGAPSPPWRRARSAPRRAAKSCIMARIPRAGDWWNPPPV